jgi:hypothetical protein
MTVRGTTRAGLVVTLVVSQLRSAHAGGVAADDLGLFVVSARIFRDWGNVDSLCR